MSETSEMRREGLGHLERARKNRCTHGVFKYGECAECREEADCFREVMQQAGERITKAVEADEEAPKIVRCSQHHRDYNISEGCPECKLSKEDFIARHRKGFGPDTFDVWGQTQKFTPNGKKPSHLGDCLDEAKKTICGERQDVYGSPEDSFQIIAEYWSTYLRHEYNSDHHHLRAKDVAHMMILFKMARVQGQAPKRDNYVDLCGYAAIAADRLSPEAAATIKGFEEMMFPKDVTWKDGSPGCPHTRTKLIKKAVGEGIYRQCLGCGARLEVE